MPSNMGLSVWRTVWVMTNCWFMSAMLYCTLETSFHLPALQGIVMRQIMCVREKVFNNSVVHTCTGTLLYSLPTTCAYLLCPYFSDSVQSCGSKIPKNFPSENFIPKTRRFFFPVIYFYMNTRHSWFSFCKLHMSTAQKWLIIFHCTTVSIICSLPDMLPPRGIPTLT